MNSTAALKRFREIISSSLRVSEYCGSELRWIENRERDWTSDRIRVGVIGVTSSGKSTLINAILGSEILSSAIAPSSGRLVCCSYGETAEIIIHLEDGRSIKLTGSDYSREVLEQYSDERYNPKNVKGVAGIELTSPMFDLGKDVLLIDSPGLDAFGLESHEKLTLESLVPTIDACIYVTTMKANSDRKTSDILNVVARYNCPVIIVQNMLDSVRPSPGGDKTSEQVARDHRTRVRRIVDRSDIADKNSVHIIQMSAALAKRWRTVPTSASKDSDEIFAKSNYSAFTTSVTEILEMQRPQIERQRLLSIRASAGNLLSFAEAKVNKPAAILAPEFPFSEFRGEVERHEQDVVRQYEHIVSKYKTEVTRIKALTGKGSRQPSPPSMEELIAITNRTVSDFGAELAKLVARHNEFVMRAAEKVNIPVRDLLDKGKLHPFTPVTLQKRAVRATRRVKRGGVGLIMRGFGHIAKIFHDNDWGWKTEEYTHVETDVAATEATVVARLADALLRHTQYMRTWEKDSFRASLDKVCAEIDEAERGYNIRRDAAVESEALADLCGSLREFLADVDAALPAPMHSAPAQDDTPPHTTTQTEVSPYVQSVLKLSRHSLKRQHRAVARAFVRAVNCEKSTPVIISWDAGATAEFLWQTGIVGAVIPDSPTDNSAIRKIKNRCVFILVNAIQYGAAVKQIEALKLNEILSKRDFVVWVVQDFQELLIGDQAAEGLKDVSGIASLLMIDCRSAIYILHENPVYNIAFLKYQLVKNLRKSPHDLIHEIQTTYAIYSSEETESALGKILRGDHLR